jgi:hypothetical protein
MYLDERLYIYSSMYFYVFLAVGVVLTSPSYTFVNSLTYVMLKESHYGGMGGGYMEG